MASSPLVSSVSIKREGSPSRGRTHVGRTESHYLFRGWTGLNQIWQGRTGQGIGNVVTGSTSLGLNLASYTQWGLSYSAGLTGKVAVGASVVSFGAFYAATTSVGLAADSINAALEGRETPVDVANDFWTQYFYENVFDPAPASCPVPALGSGRRVPNPPEP